MKNETQSALVARDAAIILLLIWAFMQALLMIGHLRIRRRRICCCCS